MTRKNGLADSPFFTPPPKEAVPIFSNPPPAENTVSRHHATTIPDDMVEHIRKAVKEFGKEAATHRFTSTEKRSLANIIHTLHMQGIRTTENEIARIAINFVIDDFNKRGKDSLLGLVLQALNQ
jgi:CO dehydrogenase/acetyl-CoA synthase delta subunit